MMRGVKGFWIGRSSQQGVKGFHSSTITISLEAQEEHVDLYQPPLTAIIVITVIIKTLST